MICPKCGNALADVTEHCKYCGHEFSEEQQEIAKVKLFIREIETQEVFQGSRSKIKEFYINRLHELEGQKALPGNAPVKPSQAESKSKPSFSWEKNVQLILLLGVFTFIVALGFFAHSQWLELDGQTKVSLLALASAAAMLAGTFTEKRWGLPATGVALIGLGSAMIPITVFTARYYGLIDAHITDTAIWTGAVWGAFSIFLIEKYLSELFTYQAIIAGLFIVFGALVWERPLYFHNYFTFYACILQALWHCLQPSKEMFSACRRPLQFSAHLLAVTNLIIYSLFFLRIGGDYYLDSNILYFTLVTAFFAASAIQLKSRCSLFIAGASFIIFCGYIFDKYVPLQWHYPALGAICITYLYIAAWRKGKQGILDPYVVRFARIQGVILLASCAFFWLILDQGSRGFKSLWYPVIGILAALSFMKEGASPISTCFLTGFIILLIYEVFFIFDISEDWSWTISAMIALASSFVFRRYHRENRTNASKIALYGIGLISLLYLLYYPHLDMHSLITDKNYPLIFCDLLFASAYYNCWQSSRNPLLFTAFIAFFIKSMWMLTSFLIDSVDILLPLNAIAGLVCALFAPPAALKSSYRITCSLLIIAAAFTVFSSNAGGFPSPGQWSVIATLAFISMAYLAKWTKEREFGYFIAFESFAYLCFINFLHLQQVHTTEAYSAPLGLLLILTFIERQSVNDFYSKPLFNLAAVPLLLPSLAYTLYWFQNYHTLYGLLLSLGYIFCSMILKQTSGIVIGTSAFITMVLIKAFHFLLERDLSKAQWGMIIGGSLIIIGIMAELYRRKGIPEAIRSRFKSLQK